MSPLTVLSIVFGVALFGLGIGVGVKAENWLVSKRVSTLELKLLGTEKAFSDFRAQVEKDRADATEATSQAQDANQKLLAVMQKTIDSKDSLLRKKSNDLVQTLLHARTNTALSPDVITYLTRLRSIQSDARGQN